MPLTLRTPTTGDASELGRVHVRAWQAAYAGGLMADEYLVSLSVDERSSMWRRRLENPPGPRSTRVVADVDGEVIGFALAGPANGDEHGEVGELYAINVDPDHWGEGAGRALMSTTVDALRRSRFSDAVLWVHVGNTRARRFYAAGGWTDDAVGRQHEVLGAEVAEARFSLRLDR